MNSFIPKKQRRNAFKLTECPRNKVRFQKVAGLQIPSSRGGKTADWDTSKLHAAQMLAEQDYTSAQMLRETQMPLADETDVTSVASEEEKSAEV